MQEVQIALAALGDLTTMPYKLQALQAALRPSATAEAYLQGITRTVPSGYSARLLLLRRIEESLGHRDTILAKTGTPRILVRVSARSGSCRSSKLLNLGSACH